MSSGKRRSVAPVSMEDQIRHEREAERYSKTGSPRNGKISKVATLRIDKLWILTNKSPQQ